MFPSNGEIPGTPDRRLNGLTLRQAGIVAHFTVSTGFSCVVLNRLRPCAPTYPNRRRRSLLSCRSMVRLKFMAFGVLRLGSRMLMPKGSDPAKLKVVLPMGGAVGPGNLLVSVALGIPPIGVAFTVVKGLAKLGDPTPGRSLTPFEFRPSGGLPRNCNVASPSVKL